MGYTVTRRSFLLGLIAAPVASLHAETFTIVRTDSIRFSDSVRLCKDLKQDIEDMDIHTQRGLNLSRCKEEDHLYREIQTERGRYTW